MYIVDGDEQQVNYAAAAAAAAAAATGLREREREWDGSGEREGETDRSYSSVIIKNILKTTGTWVKYAIYVNQPFSSPTPLSPSLSLSPFGVSASSLCLCFF